MKAIAISLLIAGAIIGGSIILVNSKNNPEETAGANNVTIVDGKQIIEITARGGYLPRKSVAKSGIPTVIRFNTKGTFDCSSSIRIPSLSIYKNLPQTGVTDIDIGSGKTGILQGSCGMGMYPFEVEFQD